MLLPESVLSISDYLDILCLDYSLKYIPNRDQSIELLLPLANKLIEQSKE
jgi:hypothetical protein